MHTLNLGILAHVDAGKTSLTERLLHTAGVIGVLGSVDAGTTQTDSMALERQRGITIRAAVVGLTLGDVSINLIDTPGHPDFIAEVERSLRVLAGAVLVVSAVEGVQAQTVVLMRALRRLRVPTLIFVNKIDRAGADPDRVVTEIRERLAAHVIPMGRAEDVGGPSASYQAFPSADPTFAEALVDVLIEHDDALLADAVGGDPRVNWGDTLVRRLAAQTAAALVNPVYCGSAMTGAGIGALVDGLTTLLPPADQDRRGIPSGLVFKVDRDARGEKVAYVRLFSGSVRVRDRLHLGADRDVTVTGVKVFRDGAVVDSEQVGAGQIGLLYGLRDIRIGDPIGEPPPQSLTWFAPPTMESVVVSREPSQRAALHTALAQLAESDPLINIRQDDGRHELLISLYGEVQKEVIEHALAVDFGVEVEFRETTVICTERITGTGQALVQLGDQTNPYVATIGLTLGPGPVGSGIDFRIAVEVEAVPLYVYKSLDAFRASMTDYTADALAHGLCGWRIEDCVVTLTQSGYNSPSTTASDFRRLTPLVLRAALERAGTVVCEPIQRFRLDAPADTVSAVFGLLTRHRAQPQGPVVEGNWFWVAGDIPAAEVRHVQRHLHRATHGSGVLEVHFDHYAPAPVRQPAPGWTSR